MRYSHEYKLECIELYREGKWPETPEGIKSKENFHKMIRSWVRIEENCGSDALRHKETKKDWSAKKRYELVAQVLAGQSIKETAYRAGINTGMLSHWVQKYKEKGYNGLVEIKKSRPPKESTMKRNVEPMPLTKSEREELIRLRAENEYIKAENEVIKKQIALRHERFAAQLKAKKQRLSKISGRKDTT